MQRITNPATQMPCFLQLTDALEHIALINTATAVGCIPHCFFPDNPAFLLLSHNLPIPPLALLFFLLPFLSLLSFSAYHVLYVPLYVHLTSCIHCVAVQSLISVPTGIVDDLSFANLILCS